ncbi:hypothetical protein HDV63DRAFT_378011 [Trichoderma sp. SZMC 28014]
MPVTKAGQRHILAVVLFLAITCAAVRAADGGAIIPAIDQTKHTCATFYRLDDVTEMDDEIRRCLIDDEIKRYSIP